MKKIDFHLTLLPSHHQHQHHHIQLCYLFIKCKTLLTSADFHIVFPPHTANNKQKTFY